jgi:hypothetical protein
VIYVFVLAKDKILNESIINITETLPNNDMSGHFINVEGKNIMKANSAIPNMAPITIPAMPPINDMKPDTLMYIINTAITVASAFTEIDVIL